MNVKQIYVKYLMVATSAGGLLFTSCRVACEITAQYEVTKIEGSMITIDSVRNTISNAKATEILKSYKEEMDAMTYEVIGASVMKIDKGGSESLPSGLVVGVLQQAAVQVLRKPADMGLVNTGGLRNILPEGDTTAGDVFEIPPFESPLCVLITKRIDLRRPPEAIVSLHGEGVSGIRLEIIKNGKLLNALVGEKPLKDDQLYTVAVIDYLIDGNGRVGVFLQAEKRVCPEDAILHGLFLDYVCKQTAEGKAITPKLDGRTTIK